MRCPHASATVYGYELDLDKSATLVGSENSTDVLCLRRIACAWYDGRI